MEAHMRLCDRSEEPLIAWILRPCSDLIRIYFVRRLARDSDANMTAAVHAIASSILTLEQARGGVAAPDAEVHAALQYAARKTAILEHSTVGVQAGVILTVRTGGNEIPCSAAPTGHARFASSCCLALLAV